MLAAEYFSRSDSDDALFNEANARAHARDYVRAVNRYDRLLARNPGLPRRQPQPAAGAGPDRRDQPAQREPAAGAGGERRGQGARHRRRHSRPGRRGTQLGAGGDSHADRRADPGGPGHRRDVAAQRAAGPVQFPRHQVRHAAAAAGDEPADDGDRVRSTAPLLRVCCWSCCWSAQPAATAPTSTLQELVVRASWNWTPTGPRRHLVPGQKLTLSLDHRHRPLVYRRHPHQPARGAGLVILQTEQFASNASERRGDQGWVLQRWTLDVYPQRAGEFTIPAVTVRVKVNAGDAGEVEGTLAAHPWQLHSYPARRAGRVWRSGWRRRSSASASVSTDRWRACRWGMPSSGKSCSTAS